VAPLECQRVFTTKEILIPTPQSTNTISFIRISRSDSTGSPLVLHAKVRTLFTSMFEHLPQSSNNGPSAGRRFLLDGFAKRWMVIDDESFDYSPGRASIAS
jgi:hypothetical protein